MTVSAPVYAAFFMGQFGYAFSMPFAAIASQAKAKGIEIDVFAYTDIWKAKDALHDHAYAKCAVVGYSLGVTTATYLQTQMRVDLLLSIAASTLAGDNNHLVNHANTKRSILYRGTDFLSSAGLHDGYDEVINVTAGWGIPVWSHLNIPANPTVIDGVLGELAKLKGN
jgi:hypothetical protein